MPARHAALVVLSLDAVALGLLLVVAGVDQLVGVWRWARGR